MCRIMAPRAFAFTDGSRCAADGSVGSSAEGSSPASYQHVSAACGCSAKRKGISQLCETGLFLAAGEAELSMGSLPSPQPWDALEFSSQSLESGVPSTHFTHVHCKCDARRDQAFLGITGDAFDRGASLCVTSGMIAAAIWFWFKTMRCVRAVRLNLYQHKWIGLAFKLAQFSDKLLGSIPSSLHHLQSFLGRSGS